jgi:hypothetical protein
MNIITINGVIVTNTNPTMSTWSKPVSFICEVLEPEVSFLT